MNYGIQLYSIRDLAKNDMDAALRHVSELGYEFVEFAGFFDNSAEEIKEMLDKYSLKAYATHTNVSLVSDEMLEETIAFHKAIGCKNLIFPGADLKTGAKIDDFVALVKKVQERLAEEGIELHYHNHSHEFLPNEDGLYIHYELEKRTSLKFEIDTFWAYNADRDPVAMMERLKDRISVIHLKDGFKGGKGIPLGEGTAPVLAVMEKAKELGIVMVVESETLTPDGPTEVAKCAEFLKKN
ncbi:MAG: sugar phosphate isomerase/epimerase [Clostridia bacterium]|nr:sugar phosphate isomerase/epimerase [Clostridia bacterium]